MDRNLLRVLSMRRVLTGLLVTRRASARVGLFAVSLLWTELAVAQTSPDVPPAPLEETTPVPGEPLAIEPGEQIAPPRRAVPPLLTLPPSTAPNTGSNRGGERSPILAEEAALHPDEWDEPRSESNLEQRRWYGWQTLLTDAAALGLLVGAASSQSTATPGLALYALGGPGVHAGHGHAGKALGSLALRVSLPVTVGYVGYAIDSANCGESEWFCGLEGAAAGILVGTVAAITIDSAVLANEDAVGATRKNASRRVRFAPAVSVVPGRYSAGLVGTF